jgi:hypothetical protein
MQAKSFVGKELAVMSLFLELDPGLEQLAKMT